MSFASSFANAACFVFRQGELLVAESDALPTLPPAALLEAAGFEHSHAIGTFDEQACWVFEVPAGWAAPAGYGFVGLRAAYGRLAEPAFAMAGRAAQVLTWLRDHRFCGRCGQATEPGEALSRLCPSCGAHHFPRLSPAVIVAVRRGDRVLLARSPRFAPGMFSTVAGFVEPGETLEQAVAREVMEEVGLQVTNVRYFGSQPWPFPHSLMIGFTAEWAGGEPTPDRDEILEAEWFGVEAMPVVPGRISIARALIDDFVRSQGGDPDALRSP